MCDGCAAVAKVLGAIEYGMRIAGARWRFFFRSFDWSALKVSVVLRLPAEATLPSTAAAFIIGPAFEL